MSSPLNWFRKRQKLLMGIFGVALMFVFTISLGTNVDPLVDFLSGNWGRNSTRDPQIASWAGGAIHETEVQELRARRIAVARYLFQVEQAGKRKGGTPRDSRFDLQTSDQALVQLRLLVDEAQKLGISVSDADIKDYLMDLCDDRLEEWELKNLWEEITAGRSSDRQLFMYIRPELMAHRLKLQVIAATATASPVRTWDLFNRLERRAQIELMPIQVDDFLDQIPDPTPAELKTFFEAHKDNYPQPESPVPGFRQRERRAFEFVKFDYQAFLAAEARAITPAAAREFYDANKEKFQVTDLPESDLALPAGDDEPDREMTPAKDVPSRDEDDPSSTPTPIPQQSDESTTAEQVETSVADDGTDNENPAAADPATSRKEVETSDAGNKSKTTEGAFKPFEEVEQEIREYLALPATQKRVEAAIAKTRSALADYLRKRSQALASKDKEPLLPSLPDLSAISQDPVLKIESISLCDVVEIQDHPLGQLRDTEASEEGSRLVSFAERAFDPSMTPFRVTIFPVQTYLWPQNVYLYWVSHIEPEYEPSLDEVRDQVVRIWKRTRALDLALAAAEKEAAKAREAAGRSLAEVCLAEGRVFYGPLDVEWITTGSVPTGSGAILQLGSIPDVKGTTPEALRTIFSLRPNEVGVITDAPKLTVYVVRLVNDAPNAEIRRSVFMRQTDWYGAVQALLRNEQSEQFRLWYVELLKRKKVEWNTKSANSGRNVS